jgi:hypothetical protein
MLLKNNTCRKLEVLIDDKHFVWNPSESVEIEEKYVNFVMMIQPLLTKVEEVEIHTKPVEMKVVKNVKNKKSRK